MKLFMLSETFHFSLSLLLDRTGSLLEHSRQTKKSLRSWWLSEFSSGEIEN